eukprot:TRINITY_DN2940_c3_g1_i1.p1 TRINITY_DN2940_c3_g1~~TRINITY_DN2940_c3_g1_i1.p1  ORF type:complete len:310 (+),score=8.23 TRINITY_DN2940_c3_g1_i1:323-1252(+)
MSEVEIYMYDISKGMARALGPVFGVQIEAIWHTSVVAYGYEYLFAGGGGVLKEEPGTTPFGTPIEKRVMGRTSKTRIEFESWNRSQNESAFGPESYNLMENNCNHYSDAALRFLVNEGAPSTVSNMTSNIVNSPIGRMALQFLESVQEGLQNRATPATAEPSSSADPSYWCHMCDREVSVVRNDEGEVHCAICTGEFVEVYEQEAPQSEEVVPPVLPPVLEGVLSSLSRGIASLLESFPQSRRTPEETIAGLPQSTLSSECGSPCGICLESFPVGTRVTHLPCDHFFHTPCIEQWLRLRKNCPACRHEL